MTFDLIRKKLPLIISTVFLSLTVFMFIKASINIIFIFKSFIDNRMYYYPLLGNPFDPSLILMIILMSLFILAWLFSTRVKFFQSFPWRLVQFSMLLGAVTSLLLWNVTAAVYKYVVPYFLNKADMIDLSSDKLQEVMLGNTQALLLLVMALPYIAVILLTLYISGLFNQYREEIIESFKTYEVTSRWLQKVTKSERDTGLPDVILGPDSETKEEVMIPGKDRTLNTMIIGSIGTGKTAAVATPMINQDLHHFVKYINDFQKMVEEGTLEKLKGDYLNGLVVIEPSNDLCQSVYRLCLAHGIPEEAIYYVDPTNDETPAINPLQGPVDKVAESLTMVVEGLGENDNFFFAQSQRAHFKQYIYLLKLHSKNNEDPTMADLYEMYNDVQLVHLMHLKLKKRIEEEAPQAKTDRERDFWSVVQDVDRWFDATVIPVKDFKTQQMMKIESGKYKGMIEYYDKKGEFIEGLKNILTDISSNVLLRKVLFRKSTFDFDAHLKAGGILLVNTEKGDLMELSNVLGKMVLLSVQNAVFRRQPKVEPYHSIYADEFADYIYKPFKSFPAQSRKYKAIIHVIAQTIAQLADDFGDKYMHTVLTTFRNKIVYSDVSQMDAETFSFLFHEKNNYVESTTEQSVSPLQESPVTRMGMSYQQEKDSVMSPADILSLKAFEAAAKIVVDNESKPARRIKANFVPEIEFTEAIVKVNPEAAAFWIKERNRIIGDEDVKEVEEIAPIETVEEQEERLEEEAAHEEKLLSAEDVDHSIKHLHDKQPRGTVRFDAPPPARLRNRSEEVSLEDATEAGVQVKVEGKEKKGEVSIEQDHTVERKELFDATELILKKIEAKSNNAQREEGKSYSKSAPSNKEKALFNDLVESMEE